MADKNKQLDIIFTQRHPDLQARLDIWELVYDSYVGGYNYKNGNYLIKYPKESQGSFNKRKDRAVYFNQLSPVVDMVSGFLYLNTPAREVPEELNYLLESTSGNKNINEFMRLVTAYSFMFTCGILIDSPDFDPEVIKTKRDRLNNKINPYAVFYLPFQIRNFNINKEDGELDWVLLDNSYYDQPDPMVKGETVYKYTLWTRTTSQNFIKRGEKGTIEFGDEKPHNLGTVPFRFVSWRDDNNDFIAETVCEDIAMISKLIYNNMSYMDEMLASGTFKMLAYPSEDGEVPEALKIGGVGPLSVISYPTTSSTAPHFIGAELTGIDPFIKAINFYMTEILKKVGLSTDEMKEFVKSGTAKKIDMQKLRALLIAGAQIMGKVEAWIYKIAALWEGKKDLGGKAEYSINLSDEDLQTEMMMFTELMVYPIKSLQKESLKLQVKKILANYLKPDILDVINKEIDSMKSILQVQETNGAPTQVLTATEIAAKIKSQNNKGV
jgi:hypothetical protein